MAVAALRAQVRTVLDCGLEPSCCGELKAALAALVAVRSGPLFGAGLRADWDTFVVVILGVAAHCRVCQETADERDAFWSEVGSQTLSSELICQSVQSLTSDSLQL